MAEGQDKTPVLNSSVCCEELTTFAITELEGDRHLQLPLLLGRM